MSTNEDNPVCECGHRWGDHASGLYSSDGTCIADRVCSEYECDECNGFVAVDGGES